MKSYHPILTVSAIAVSNQRPQLVTDAIHFAWIGHLSIIIHHKYQDLLIIILVFSTIQILYCHTILISSRWYRGAPRWYSGSVLDPCSILGVGISESCFIFDINVRCALYNATINSTTHSLWISAIIYEVYLLSINICVVRISWSLFITY